MLKRLYIGFVILIILTILVRGSFVVLGLTTNLMPAIVISGSMSPAINTGDVVIIDTASFDYAVGDVIIFSDDHPIPTTQRITDILQTEDGIQFLTKGDANQYPDLPVSSDKVQGKIVTKIPKIGYFLLLTSNLLVQVGMSLASAAIILHLLVKRRWI